MRRVTEAVKMERQRAKLLEADVHALQGRLDRALNDSRINQKHANKRNNNDSKTHNITNGGSGKIANNGIFPVLIFCHDRAEYLRRALESAVHNRRDPRRFPIFVSQDTVDAMVTDVVSSFSAHVSASCPRLLIGSSR